MISVGIAKFKAHLSYYLREAKQGKTIEILDRGQVTAQLTSPLATRNGLAIRPAKGSLRDLKPPMPSRFKQDAVALLLEDRRKR